MNRALEEGIYTIMSVPSGKELRAYGPRLEIYVENREPLVPYGYWILTFANDGGYTIENAGLHLAVTAARRLDAPVIVDDKGVSGTTFAIEKAGGNEFIVKLPFDDLEWAMDPLEGPEIPAGFAKVKLRHSGLGNSEHFTFKKMH